MFQTASGAKLTHVAIELERFSELFGKRFAVTPTNNRKAIATVVGLGSSEAEERRVANFMSHSIDVARSSYQHLTDDHRAVDIYQSLHRTAVVAESDNNDEAPTALLDTSMPPSTSSPRSDPSEVPPPKRRKIFTEEETAVVSKYFNVVESVARGQKLPSLELCREFLVDNSSGIKGRTAKNIQDNVDTLRKQLLRKGMCTK